MAADIYKFTSTGLLTRAFGLRGQIPRPAVSSMSNIAEGFERDGNKEFVQFLSMAKGSTGEVRSQLNVALDGGHLSPADFRGLSANAEAASRLIGGLMRYVQPSDLRDSRTNARSMS